MSRWFGSGSTGSSGTGQEVAQKPSDLGKEGSKAQQKAKSSKQQKIEAQRAAIENAF